MRVATCISILTSHLGLLLLGLSTWRERSWEAWLALGLAAVSLLGVVGGPLRLMFAQHGGGLAERVVLYPYVVYLVILGAALVSRRTHVGTATAGAA